MTISNTNRAYLVIVLLLSTFMFTLGASADAEDNLLVFISGVVIFDRDSSGSLTPADDGLESVTVSLLSDSGDVLLTQETDANGSYLFSGLELGTYSVEVDTDTLPMGVSRLASLTPESPVTLEQDNSSVANYDFGYASTLSIGDLVFLDIRETIPGVQDVGDIPLAGVIVELYNIDMDNALVASVTTNDDGRYQFANLEPGNYFIRFTVPDSLREALLADGLIESTDVLAFVDANSGDDSELDSDVSRVSQDEDGSNIGETSTITLAPGSDNNYSFDAGIATESTIPLAVQTNGVTAVTQATLHIILILTMCGTVAVAMASVASRK